LFSVGEGLHADSGPVMERVHLDLLNLLLYTLTNIPKTFATLAWGKWYRTQGWRI
jgi:hypothetical protein